MVPVVKRHDLGGGRVMDYFRRCRHWSGPVETEASIHAIEQTLPGAYRRSSEIKAMASWIKEPQEDRRIGLIAADASEVDPLSVIPLRRLVCELEPSWVEAVREACRHTNILEEIAEDAGEVAGEDGSLDLNAVAAIVSVLVENGELSEFEAGGYEDEE